MTYAEARVACPHNFTSLLGVNHLKSKPSPDLLKISQIKKLDFLCGEL